MTLTLTSVANLPGQTCYITVVTIAGTPHWKEFCQKVADIWSKLQGACPHWAKEWDFLEGIDGFLRQVCQYPFNSCCIVGTVCFNQKGLCLI